MKVGDGYRHLADIGSLEWGPSTPELTQIKCRLLSGTSLVPTDYPRSACLRRGQSEGPG